MKYQYSKDSKTFKVFTALRSGEALTESAARKRFGIGNLRAEVTRSRNNGYAVYTNDR